MTGEVIMRGARWLVLKVRLAFGALCWGFFMIWPSWRGGAWTRIGHAVLPWAGHYAYANDPWVRECDAYWIRTGQKFRAHQDKGGENG